jgi:CP family cyanate transporter-like MFS transporter
LKKPALIAPAFVVILAGIAAALHVGKMPPAIPVLREALGLTLLQAGFLLSAVQLAGMALGVLVGLASDSLGLRRSMLFGLCVLAISSAAGGWARAAADLLWLRATEGFGFLLVALPAPSLIRQLVPSERLALKLGLWGAYMPTGTALALVCGPWVMAAIGWQGWWWLLAGISAGMALWMAISVPSDRQRRAIVALPSAAVGDIWWRRLGLTLATPGPWLVALIFAMYSSQWLAVIGFLPFIYAQAGLSGTLGGALTALASLVNVLGNIGAGRLLHRGIHAKRLLYIGFAAMALGSFLAFGQFLGEFPILRYLAVLMFSAVGGMIPAVLFSLAVQLAPSERTVSTTVGWVQQWSSTGQFLGPPLVAWVAGATGAWNWTWIVTGTASLVGLLLAGRLSLAPSR